MSRLESHFRDRIAWTLDRSKPVPDHFGDPMKEVAIMQSEVALLDFSHYECLVLTGEERISLLGGLVTNQVKNVTATRSIYTAHLTPQGRFLWDFTIIAEENRLLLITEPTEARALAQRLGLFLLRAKVGIEEQTDAWGLLGIVGPKALPLLQSLFPTLSLTDAPLGATWQLENRVHLWLDPRHADFGWRLLVPVESLPAWWDRLAQQIPPAGFTAWEAYRIRQGLPRGGNEFIPETTLPLESGLLELHGVDFAKGCYVGQETTTRTHHRGTLKKRLFSLMLSNSDEVAPGTPILLPNGKESGILTSLSPLPESGGRVGLGILHVATATPKEGHTLTLANHPVTARKPEWALWGDTSV
ncbi:MAG: hypothetical protein H7839_14345 [Magnetococcus sp. YQC-5]